MSDSEESVRQVESDGDSSESETQEDSIARDFQLMNQSISDAEISANYERLGAPIPPPPPPLSLLQLRCQYPEQWVQ